MTPTFCCGFECGQFGLVGQHWKVGGTGVSIDTITKRNGARSLRLNPSSSLSYVTSPILNSQAVGVIRVAIRFAVLPSNNFFLATPDSTGAGAIFQASDSKIYAIAASSIGATGVSVTTGVWYVLDVLIDLRSNPWVVDVKVNGVACAQKTAAVGASSDTRWKLGSSSGISNADVYFDDFILSSDATDYPIGDGYVNHFVPTADGTHNISGAADFRRGETTTDILNSTTTAYQLVDEVPLDDTTPDADDHIRIAAPAAATDYVELVFGPAPGISTPTVAPRAVEVITEVFAAGTGLADEQIKVNDNGTVDTLYDGTGIAGIVTGTYKRKHYPLAPTGGAWTVAAGAGDFNNLRLRYGYSTDANPDKSLMCAMVEAEFAALATGRRRINVT